MMLKRLLFASRNSQDTGPYKREKDFESRKKEAASVRAKYAGKVPVIVERCDNERYLPVIKKSKFLVPEDLTVAQFYTIIRNRLQLSEVVSLILLVNNRDLSTTKTLGKVYTTEQDEDGFLYITYATFHCF